MSTSANGERVMKQVTFYKWCKTFVEGRKIVIDERCAGRNSGVF